MNYSFAPVDRNPGSSVSNDHPALQLFERAPLTVHFVGLRSPYSRKRPKEIDVSSGSQFLKVFERLCSTR
jgi:hypothetical protein